MWQTKKAKQQGFSLLEVLVAMMVLSIVVAMTFTGLRQAMAQQGRLDNSNQKFQNRNIALQVLDQDLAYIVGRWHMHEGKHLEPPLMYELSTNRLQFSRLDSAYSNSPFQALRIQYRLENGSIWRQQKSENQELGGKASPVHEYKVLAKVQSLQWRFLDSKGQWHTYWPLLGQESVLPASTEMLVQLDNGELIKHQIRGYPEVSK